MSVEVLWGIGTVVLLAALVYGVTFWSRRNKGIDPVTEEATRQEYREEERKRPDRMTPLS